MDNPRSRCWCAVLYPEDESHWNCMSILEQNGYTYAAILHDKDTWEDSDNGHVAGELKKPHWHIVLYFKNPRYLNAIADELGITPNYLEVCRNRDSSLLYLVHDGYPEKYQYDVDEVFGSLTPNLEKLLLCEDEGERVKTIIKIIDSVPARLSYRQLLLKVCDNGLYGDFRRMGSGVKYLLDEHNADFTAPWEKEQLTNDMQRFHDFEKFARWGG